MHISKLNLPIVILGISILSLFMFIYPDSTWQAAVRGLSIWWDVLFPSLFPFFVISEVLLGFGIVHFLGQILDPLMRPIFRIPGSGGFVAAMGFAAGYPVSARLAVKLREQNLIGRDEGERLVAFTTSSDPIFLIGAVSVGFFHNPAIAGILALAHYGGSVLIGLVMRFHGNKSPSPFPPNPPIYLPKTNRLKSAFLAMHKARLEDGRELGELLLQAVTSSLQLMTVVGGLVVFFSVFLEMLNASGLMAYLYQGLQFLLPHLGLPSSLSEPFVSGLFEVTLGTKNAAAATGDISLPFKVAAAAFVLSWGGLSVHAQVASILNATDLRYIPFLIARAIHAVISAILIFILWPWLGLGQVDTTATSSFNPVTYTWSASVGNLSYGVKLLGILLILSILAILIQRLKPRWNKLN